MTDKLIMTTAQRAKLCELIEKDGFPNQPAIDLLQSLPMVDSEPVAHMYPWDLERFATNETTGHAYSVAVGCADGVSVPLYTSPQALTKISADDVTDEMVAIYCHSGLSSRSDHSEQIAAAYNAVINHRSEAK